MLQTKFDGLKDSLTKHLGWKQGDEDENWAKKAIDNLMKKLLKHNKDALEILRQSLDSKGEVPTPCVTIPRSLDGRLQISHRKALPHVIYCRVYRWPDLQSHHELKAMEICRYCYESGQKEICINPYHYRRIESTSVLPPVLVPRMSEYPMLGSTSAMEASTNIRRLHEMDEESRNNMPQNIDMSGIFSTTHANQMQFAVDPMAGYASEAFIPVPFPFREGDWATISYYEMNTRVGEQIRVSSQTIFIDGYTDPTNSPNRISLGVFSNINRNQTIENTRRHIGNGVKLTYIAKDCQLFAECESDEAIFVQSRNFNFIHGFHNSTVVKITNKCSLKIFDGHYFSQLLTEYSREGFDPTYSMTKMSIIRMSFVKGWGAEYNRQDITSTPCWIEIHLHAPLKWVDDVLIQTKVPLKPISSVS